jgi:hypothetical protein
MPQVVVCLSSKQEVLSSNPNTTKKRKKKWEIDHCPHPRIPHGSLLAHDLLLPRERLFAFLKKLVHISQILARPRPGG